MIEKSKHFGTIIPFAIAIIALLALSYFSYNRIKNLIEEATWVNHANLVKVSLEKSFAALRAKESDMRVYMYSKDSVYLSSYLASDTSILLELNRLDSLISDDPLQQQNAIALKTAIDGRIEMMKNSLALFQASKLSTADRLKGNALMDDVRSHIDKMETEEDKLISIRSASFGRASFVTPLFTIFLIIGSVTFLIVSYFRISQEQNKSNTLTSKLENRTAELEVANYARSLIEASLDPLVTISVEGKILDVNAASIKVTGIPREKLIDTDFSNYFTEPEKAREGYLQVFEKGFVSDYPLTIKHKDGNLTDVLYNASVYKDDKGNVLGVFAAARDITEQKKVENVLKESEEKFKLIFEKSTAPIIVADDKGNYLEVNKAVADVFEYSINELMGMNVGDLITTSNSNAAAQYEEYIKKGEEIGEFGFISKKGTLKIVQYQAVRLKPDYNLSILMDVTEQKKASQYARSLIEANLDPLVTISAEGKILDVNAASIKVTGIAREKLIGTDFSNYFTEPKKAQEGYLQVFEKGFVSDYPLTIRHKDGNLTDVLYNASVYKDDKGNVLGVFAAARDVTEQKQASQYARSLIEANLDPLVTISAEGKITDVNAASIKVTGITREKLIGTDFSNYFTEPKKAQEGYLQVFEKGFVSDYPLTIRHKDGNLTDVLYNASVYKDSKGKILGVFAAARDVTEQKWAKDLRVANTELAYQNEEKEKRAAELSIANIELAFQNDQKGKRAAELVIANKELESFNYISSHDLQEPLRKIQVFASRLIADESQNLSSKGNDYIFRMQDAANRMQALIADLLAYSRTTSSERKFEITDLNTIIESVKKDFADALDAKNAIIEVAEMCDVRVIPFQFRQLLDNIIGNALKFAKPGLPPHIIIKSSIIKGSEVNSPKLLSEKEYCHITITDNGLGFEPQYKDQIFELFKRLHDKEKIKGTGIGLSIVRKIVDNHNGLITATSELNNGATFDIYIPAI